ncbi:hypothetical protein LCGC14_3066440, partial [marine sediment metagenome]
EGVATHVERLLAQERELMECKHPKSCWVDEGDCLIRVDEGSPPLYSPSMRRPRKYCSTCAEREKVREMCAQHFEKEALECANFADKETGESRAAWNREETRYEDCAWVIRQLDLTKDLAPSSREEGKK